MRGSNPRDLFSLRSPVACNTTSNRVWASLALANSCGLNMGPHYQRGLHGARVHGRFDSAGPALPLIPLPLCRSSCLSPSLPGDRLLSLPLSLLLSLPLSLLLSLPPSSPCLLLQREQPRTNRLRFCCDHSSYACGHGTDAIGIWTTTKPSASHSDSDSFGLSNTRRLAS